MEFHWEERVVQQRNPNPAGNYMFKVNNRNSRTRCEICSKLTKKIAERRQAVNCQAVNSEKVNAGWEKFGWLLLKFNLLGAKNLK